MSLWRTALSAGAALAALATALPASTAMAQDKKPNVVMLMADDVGWADLGVYMGGVALGHPTPNIDRLAHEGAMFTSWYGQASCTAGRASFMTGRIPIRSALSVVVVIGDANGLKKETPTIAEFYKKNGYSTYYSRQVASRRQARVLSDRARFRRDAALRRLFPRRLCLERHGQFRASLVPEGEHEILEGVQRNRELL